MSPGSAPCSRRAAMLTGSAVTNEQPLTNFRSVWSGRASTGAAQGGQKRAASGRAAPQFAQVAIVQLCSVSTQLPTTTEAGLAPGSFTRPSNLYLAARPPRVVVTA